MIKFNFTIKQTVRSGYRSLDFITRNNSNAKLVRGLEDDIFYNNGIILKSHAHHDYQRFYQNCPQLRDTINHAFNYSKIIYIYRDPKDVALSLYRYLASLGQLNCENISSFIKGQNRYYPDSYDGDKSIIEYWNYHCLSWVNQNALVLSFEEVRNNYVASLNKISSYLALPLNKKICDVRDQFRVSGDIKLTAILPWRGQIGGYAGFLDERDIEFINQQSAQTLQLLKESEQSYL